MVVIQQLNCIGDYSYNGIGPNRVVVDSKVVIQIRFHHGSLRCLGEPIGTERGKEAGVAGFKEGDT